METATFLGEILGLYAVALVAVLVLGRLRVSPIISLILTGVVCGPSGLGLVANGHEVEALAEVGVILLLFTVGLDFPLAELRRIWRTALLGGSLQIAITILCAGFGAWAATRLGVTTALFLGVFLAMSSTAIVIRGLGERNELDAPHGRHAIGVLLLQDLVVIVALTLVPVLSGALTTARLPALAGRLVVALALVTVGGRVFLPLLLRVAIRSRRREAFSLALLLASIGTAWLCARLGLPTAVGAFLGGFVLAGSEFSVQAQAEIRPLRDLLTSLFFVSVGMLLDISAIAGRLPLVAGLSVVAVVAKAAAATAALRLCRVPLRVAVAAGIVLAQVGEFSFILGRAGLAAGLIDTATWQIVLAVSLVTMLATPALVAFAPRAAAWVSRRFSPGARPEPASEAPMSGHVLIFGYGLGGQLIAKELRDEGRGYLIVDLNGATVERIRAQGEPALYGDATNPDTLAAAGLPRAGAVVLVMNDPDATLRAVRAIRAQHPTAPVIARTRYRLEAERLLAAGATTVLVEEIETSLEVLARLLACLGLPGDRVEATRAALRQGLTETRD